jgi:hypothetical protein
MGSSSDVLFFICRHCSAADGGSVGDPFFVRRVRKFDRASNIHSQTDLFVGTVNAGKRKNLPICASPQRKGVTSRGGKSQMKSLPGATA